MSGLGEPADSKSSDDFTSIPDVPVSSEADRTNPNREASGVERGTKTIMAVDGSYVTIGLVPDNSGDFGIAFFDSSGTIISKNTGATQYVYDKKTGKNIMQIGLLPDGNYGWAIARSGYNVSDGISGVS